MARVGWIAAVVFLLLALMSAASAEVGYDEQVAKWRQDFEADLSCEGWLALVGREKVPEVRPASGRVGIRISCCHHLLPNGLDN